MHAAVSNQHLTNIQVHVMCEQHEYNISPSHYLPPPTAHAYMISACAKVGTHIHCMCILPGNEYIYEEVHLPHMLL